ncbi:MAG: hypothetical protein ACXW28_07425, partial [Thermoanaerobaculia bacterium]
CGRTDDADALAESIARLKERLGLDYGAIDALQDDEGRFYICDVNPTPFWREREPDMTRFLREGLETCLV